MDVRRLEVLCELRLRGSVTAVAAAVHVTPSAVSQQLKTLEREVGVPLTERSGRGLVLTPAGEALAGAADGVSVALARADQVWRRFVESPQGVVELALFPTAGRMFLPGLLAALREVPGLSLEARDVDVTDGDFTDLVADHDVVLGYSVGPATGWDDRAVAVQHLLDEPLDVALPEGHPLAAHRRVTAVQVATSPWIAPPRDAPFERVLQEIERVADHPLTVVQRFNDTRITESLVAAGEGLALLPRHTSGGEGTGVVLRPLERIAPTRRISALLRVEHAERPSVRTVLQALGRIAAEIERAG
ncbi:LysR family transcriptional regulator [Amnibacterium endophyticum]|uniref:LysR family transcriptional regulator n=1 Tax=Amnibacterium endophyticum TaxID=2109337 RepID=A0ABW4L9U3_9MICO